MNNLRIHIISHVWLAGWLVVLHGKYFNIGCSAQAFQQYSFTRAILIATTNLYHLYHFQWPWPWVRVTKLIESQLDQFLARFSTDQNDIWYDVNVLLVKDSGTAQWHFAKSLEMTAALHPKNLRLACMRLLWTDFIRTWYDDDYCWTHRFGCQVGFQHSGTQNSFTLGWLWTPLYSTV